MNTSTHNESMPVKEVAPEFSSWEMQENQVVYANRIRGKFDDLLDAVAAVTPPKNGRYLALVKTKLEEACMFAVKGIAKPVN